MGGSIGVASSHGKGSTFWFEVPLGKPARETPLKIRPGKAVKMLVLSSDVREGQEICRRLSAMGIQEAWVSRNEAEAREYIGLVGEVATIVVVSERGFQGDALAFSETLSRDGLRGKVRLALVGDADPEEATRCGYRSIVRPDADDRTFFSAVHYMLPSEVRKDLPFGNAHGKGRSFRILVAEDNAINQEVIRKILEKAGHEVKIVNNGKAALGALLAGGFDLALLDLNMPEKSGLDAAREYLALEKEHPIPLIALTADATVESRKACIDGGFKEYITKPFDTRKVLWIIRSLVKSSGGETPSAEGGGVASVDAETPSADEMIDERMVRMLEQVDSNRDFVKNLVWIFVRDSEKRVKTMEAALEEGNCKSYRDAAHGLKGIAASIGAMRIVDLADVAQLLPESTSAEERLSYCRKLRVDLDRVKVALMRRYGVVNPAAEGARPGEPSGRRGPTRTGMDDIGS